MDPAGTDAQQNAKACYTVVQVWDVTWLDEHGAFKIEGATYERLRAAA